MTPRTIDATRRFTLRRARRVACPLPAIRGMPAPKTFVLVPMRSRRLPREHAAAVDNDSRFPAEAIAAARERRLMGVAVPREFGGEGASISEVADVCYALGRACAPRP